MIVKYDFKDKSNNFIFTYINFATSLLTKVTLNKYKRHDFYFLFLFFKFMFQWIYPQPKRIWIFHVFLLHQKSFLSNSHHSPHSSPSYNPPLLMGFFVLFGSKENNTHISMSVFIL